MRKRRGFFKQSKPKRRRHHLLPPEPTPSSTAATEEDDPSSEESSESEAEPDALVELVRSVTGKASGIDDWKDENETDSEDDVEEEEQEENGSREVEEGDEVEDTSDDGESDVHDDGDEEVASVNEESGAENDGGEEVADAHDGSEADEPAEEDVEDDQDIVEFLEDDDAPNDPFTLHFEKDVDDECLQLTKNTAKWTARKRVTAGPLGSLAYTRCDFSDTSSIPPLTCVERICENNKLNSSDDYVLKHVRNSLRIHLRESNSLNVDPDASSHLTDYQKRIYLAAASYADVLLTERSYDNAEELRLVYCMHVLNHALKTRTRVVKHNRRIQAKREKEQAALAEKGKRDKKPKEAVKNTANDEDVEFRDQGFARPKVLILLPFRDAALRVGNMLISLLVGETGKPANIVNRKKFTERFGWDDKDSRNLAEIKPADYASTFSGNIDDAFLFGISMTKKSMRFFTDLYSSDIIIASPMGLRVKIGGEGEKDRDMDFLASIEILIMDQADVFIMQNWSHVLHIFEHLHMTPSQNRGIDFSRIRMWSLSGHAPAFRQTMIFSSIPAVEISSLFNKRCRNVAGKFMSANPVVDGSISLVTIPIPQTFKYFTASSPVDESKERFQLFVEKVLPRFKDAVTKNILIFIPSYFDFVKLRNYFKKEDLDFAEICEYTEEAKIKTARNRFYRGMKKFMLFTERFHFFRRYKIKGASHIVFYGLPLYPHFYPEMINYMQGRMVDRLRKTDMSCTVIFSQIDANRLAGVVGTQKAASMLREKKESYFFVTE